MPITLGKVGKGFGSDTNTVTANWTGGGNSTSGSTLVAILSANQGSTLTPTTPTGWALRSSNFNTGYATYVYDFVGASAISGLTINYSTGGAVPVTLDIVEFQGAGAFDSISSWNHSGSGVSTLTTGSITTVAANTVLLAIFEAVSATATPRTLTTPGSGFTQCQTNNAQTDGTSSTTSYETYQVVSSTQSGVSTTCASSPTTSYQAVMVAYAAAAPAATSIFPRPKKKRYRKTYRRAKKPKALFFDLYQVPTTTQNGSADDSQFTLSPLGSETGTGTEAYTLALSDSDSGTATENGAAGALVQLDAGTGTESATLTILGTEAPTGTESDLIDPGSTTSLNVTFDYDTGTGNEVSYTLSQTVFDSGLATESATLTVQITATEAGAFNDLSAETIIGTSGGNEFNTVTDSGLGTETIARVTILGPTDTDSGTGTEGAFVLQVQASETGTGTEAAKVLPQATADAGTGSESYVITSSGPTPGTDSGTGTESALVVQTAVDAGTLADGTVSTSATISDTDAAAATDTGFKGDLDTASGSEAVTLTPEASDSGSGSESTTILGILSAVTDSGTGSDKSILTILGLDSGAGTDGASLIPIGTDSGSGTDSATLRPLGVDSGAGSEAITLATTLTTVSDSGTGSELAVLLTILGSDSGSGTESDSQFLSSSDSGTGHESITQLTLITATDSGVGLELNTFTAGRLGTGDATWFIPGSEGILVPVTGSVGGGVERHDPGSD